MKLWKLTNLLINGQKKNGILQKEIANTLEIKPQSMNRYATGKTKYTAEQIKKIAIKYNVSADILLGIIEWYSFEDWII